MIKNVVPLGEAVVKHEFVYEKNGVTTFECRELISREANGAENICVFKAVFGPREEHAKHKHTTCDEIVFCVSGRGVEGIETSPGQFEEFEYCARHDPAFAARRRPLHAQPRLFRESPSCRHLRRRAQHGQGDDGLRVARPDRRRREEGHKGVAQRDSIRQLNRDGGRAVRIRRRHGRASADAADGHQGRGRLPRDPR